ncbi:NKG2-A/NKG2-B type II integral membrane protein [Microtus ochrogaster]|uniref:NKG2-A/NKG2-B type II integral membrane protein n=1 Tax=Microtus ochrogaster TaxID=79684 RepID=A0A8J6FX82_MICOH|nr:NKG2-A/NKG2-B type II integral membrane protein [Microtus ochrogaster]
MPHSKHHEHTANEQDISYTEIKTAKSTKKQRKPKAKQSSVMLSEEQLNYAEVTFNRTPQLLSPKQVVRGKRQGPKTTVWKIVTGILGTLCVVLMTTVGILLPKCFPSPPEKLITVILGIVGFALMVAVVLITTVAKPCKRVFKIMTKNAFQNLSRTVAFN